MQTFAGIGSRNITMSEWYTIQSAGGTLRELGWTCVTGHAKGADQAFERSMGGETVIVLPWKRYNDDTPMISNYWPITNIEPIAHESVDEWHPAPEKLTAGARDCLARNYQIVAGGESGQDGVVYKSRILLSVPQVDFVLAMADPLLDKKTGDLNGLRGGTGQAARIAYSFEIPVICMRQDGWKDRLKGVLSDINTAQKIRQSVDINITFSKMNSAIAGTIEGAKMLATSVSKARSTISKFTVNTEKARGYK